MAFRKVAAFQPSGIELWQCDVDPNAVITPLGLGALAIEQLAGSVALWQCTVLPSTWVNLTSGGGSGVPLSKITAAVATNSIDSGLLAQVWGWSTLTAQIGMKFTANALTSGEIVEFSSTSAVQTGNLALFQGASTAAYLAGMVRVNATGAHTGAAFEVDSATLTGTGQAINLNALTSGIGLGVSSTSLLQTGPSIDIEAATTAALLNGALRVHMTGAHTGAAAVIDTATATGQGLVVTLNALTSGAGILVQSTNVLQTGASIDIEAATTAALLNGALRVHMTGAHTGAAVLIDDATVAGTGLSIVVNALVGGTGERIASTSAGQTGTLLELSTGSTAAFTGGGALAINGNGAHTGSLVLVTDVTVSGTLWTLASAALTTGKQLVGTANALTTGSLLDFSASSAALNSTLGLLRVANTGASLLGILARLQSNSNANSGFTVLTNGNHGMGVAAPVATHHNAGSTVVGTGAVGNLAGGGPIGAANATVDSFSAFNCSQTSAAQTLSLPNPTDTTPGRLFIVNNTGSTPFTIFGVPLANGVSRMGVWTGAAWSSVG